MSKPIEEDLSTLSSAEHVLAYLATASVLAIGYPARRDGLRIVVLLTLYAGILEIAQLWIPGRDSRLIDFAASCSGALIGICLVLSVRSLGWLNAVHRATAAPVR